MAIKFKRKDGTIRVIRNAEYLSGFYFIPKEFLDKCSAKIRSIPRRPRDLLYNEQALAVVESDVFLEAIIDVYAYMVWPYMGLGRKMEFSPATLPNGATPMRRRSGFRDWKSWGLSPQFGIF